MKFLLLFICLLFNFVLGQSGTCGYNCVWKLVDETLFIGGYGEMKNYNRFSAGWDDYKKSIKIVSIEHSITSIGEYAFCECP